MEQNETYVVILRDSLVNKRRILNELIKLTKSQAEIIKAGVPDTDKMDEVMESKGRQIDMLNMLDDGFQNIYNNVKTEVLARPEMYKELLCEIQQLINEDVELGAVLESLEMKNKGYMESFIQKKRTEIKEYRANRSSAAKYNRNMANQHVPDSSYFMDKKK